MRRVGLSLLLLVLSAGCNSSISIGGGGDDILTGETAWQNQNTKEKYYFNADGQLTGIEFSQAFIDSAVSWAKDIALAKNPQVKSSTYTVTGYLPTGIVRTLDSRTVAEGTYTIKDFRGNSQDYKSTLSIAVKSGKLTTSGSSASYDGAIQVTITLPFPGPINVSAGVTATGTLQSGQIAFDGFTVTLHGDNVEQKYVDQYFGTQSNFAPNTVWKKL